MCVVPDFAADGPLIPGEVTPVTTVARTMPSSKLCKKVSKSAITFKGSRYSGP
jgi:hypothetical protein